MGWQGEVKRKGELKRVADALGLPVERIRVFCWRDNHTYWVRVDENRTLIEMPYLRRDTLERLPNPWA